MASASLAPSRRSGGYTPSGLPFSGRTPISRLNSFKAAEAAAPGRGEKTVRYMDLLLVAGDHGLTDHEAAAALGLPLSSICSIRNALLQADIVEALGSVTRQSPYGRAVTVWVLRSEELFEQ